jgi:REP-associated tyrosine transposase
MTEKFKNKYRIPSARLPWWDYSKNALYFITICTKNREHFFGEITDGKIVLSETGKIAWKFWQEIPNHFPFIKLDAFVIMPNHVHGIIIIDKTPDQCVETPNLGVSTSNLGVSASNLDVSASNLGVSTNINNKIGDIQSKKWKSGTLGVIINQYKRICTKNARIINPRFAWQSRFYDHIVRDEKSFLRITEYIRLNPLQWQEDRER